MAKPVVAIINDQKDANESEQLFTQLNVLKQNEQLGRIWRPYDIGGGDINEDEFFSAMAQANIVLLLITANFFTDFIKEKAIPYLRFRHESNLITVFPIIAKPCSWKSNMWIEKMQVRPRDGVPIWPEPNVSNDSKLAEITNEIADIAAKFKPPLKDRPIRIKRKAVEITISGDRASLTTEDKADLVRKLATVLGYSLNELSLRESAENNNVLEIEMPADMADWLMKLYQTDNLLIQKLGITRIRIISKSALDEPKRMYRVQLLVAVKLSTILSSPRKNIGSFKRNLGQALDIPSEDIGENQIYGDDKTVFDFNLSEEGVRRLRTLLASDPHKLNRLGIEGVKIDPRRGKAKIWQKKTNDLIRMVPGELSPDDFEIFPLPGMRVSVQSFVTVRVDELNQVVQVGGNYIHNLDPVEFNLLRIMYNNLGQVFSVKQLAEELGGSEKNKEKVYQVIRELRKKIEPDPKNPIYIVTVLRYGYALVKPDLRTITKSKAETQEQ